MITKEQFVEILTNHIEFDDTIEKWWEDGIDLLNSPLTSLEYKTIDIILNVFFNEDGVSLIYWWLYEDLESDDKKIEEEDGKVILLDSLETLYDYLINSKSPLGKHLYLKC